MAADLPEGFTSASAHGQTFVFADSGSGPLVVLWHGFPDTPHGWLPAARALNSAGYRTVVPFLRGYHPATIVEGRRYGTEEIGEDAVRLLDAIEAERAVLVGHDWGAAVTYRAAATAPDRVRAMCAVAIAHPRFITPSPSLAWGARHFLTLRLPTGTWLARHDDFAHIDVLMRRWAPNWRGPERDAALADVKAAFADPVVLDGALRYYRDFAPGRLGQIACPGLIVGGTADILPVSAIEQTPQAFTGPCEVLVLPGAGHWPHRESAAQFQARLIGWLSGLPAA
jgi:pimeloyl-ACP methyl ester carboxylesterase